MENGKGAPPSELMPNQHVRSAIFHFLLSVFFVSLALIGCASPGEPIERKPPVPQAVTDLAAARSGNDVILTFTLPTETVDRRPLDELPGIEIYRSFESAPTGGNPSQAPAHLTLLATIPSAVTNQYTDRGHVRYEDPLHGEDFANHPQSVAVYAVRTRASEKKDSANSNSVEVQLRPALDPISDEKTEVTHSAVIVTWTAPQKTIAGPPPPIAGYNVYRGETDAGASAAPGVTPKLTSPLARIGESDANSPSFRDQQFDFGKTYMYSVRSIAQYPGETLESGDSNLAVVTPRDVFPPAAPLGLVVVLVPAQGDAPAHLELSWAISPETDVVGYNVYRTEQAGVPGTRLDKELLLTPAFRDMNVLPGRRYFYAVTAVDRSGVESPLSEVVAGGVLAEGQTTP
jgi:hypothetical protein